MGLTTMNLDMNGTAVRFPQAHRQQRTDPVLVTVSAPIELSFDDLVAALFLWEPPTWDEITDDRAARELIAEAVFNLGCNGLEEARSALLNAESTALPGDDVWEWVAFCRQRVTDLFGPTVPTPRRELAEVRA